MEPLCLITDDAGACVVATWLSFFGADEGFLASVALSLTVERGLLVFLALPLAFAYTDQTTASFGFADAETVTPLDLDALAVGKL